LVTNTFRSPCVEGSGAGGGGTNARFAVAVGLVGDNVTDVEAELNPSFDAVTAYEAEAPAIGMFVIE
jgi:hypothetical protein